MSYTLDPSKIENNLASKDLRNMLNFSKAHDLKTNPPKSLITVFEKSKPKNIAKHKPFIIILRNSKRV